MRLALSGNIYVDTVIEIDELKLGNNYNSSTKVQLGGIINVARTLNSLGVPHSLFSVIDTLGSRLLSEDPNIETYSELSLQPIDGKLDEAIIIVEKTANRRTSFVKKGSSDKTIISCDFLAEYHHISYLDNLLLLETSDLKKMKNNGVKISADLCMNFISNQFNSSYRNI